MERISSPTTNSNEIIIIMPMGSIAVEEAPLYRTYYTCIRFGVLVLRRWNFSHKLTFRLLGLMFHLDHSRLTCLMNNNLFVLLLLQQGPLGSGIRS